MKFIVLDEDGDLVSMETTASAARAVAHSEFDDVIDQTGGNDPPRQNPTIRGVYRPGTLRDAGPSVILGPEELDRPLSGRMALKAAGLAQISEEEVTDLTEGFTDWTEVRERLAPVLVGTALGRCLATGYKFTPGAIGKALLASNYKMSKGKKNAVTCPSCKVPMAAHAPPPGTVDKSIAAVKCPRCGVLSRLGNVRGLVLTPFYFGLESINEMMEKYGTEDSEGLPTQPGNFFGTKEKNAKGLKYIVKPMLEKGGHPDAKFYTAHDGRTMTAWTVDGKPWKSNATLCLNSSPGCRAACLCLTGQQLTNFGPKLAYTKAIMEQPAAFYALLTIACQSFFEDTSKTKFLRLNVLSDIPYELTFPALFDLAPGQYYDYTKVPPIGRKDEQPDNYDWTHSFNGQNWRQCEESLKSGYRVAVVFVQADPKRGHHPKDRLKKLPETFMGYEVIDGDGDDMRALDKPGVIVGLRYKKPKLVKEHFEKASRFTSGFVVPVADVDGHLIAIHTPGQSGADDFHVEQDEKYIYEAVLAQHPEYGIVDESEGE